MRSFGEVRVQIDQDPPLEPEAEAEDEDEDSLDNDNAVGRTISDLCLSAKATNCLERDGILAVSDLVTKTDEDLLSIRNLGMTTLTEIRQKLRELGLKLKGD